MKNNKSVSAFIIVFWIFIQSCSCSSPQMFQVIKHKLATIDVPNKNFKVIIFYLPSNATSDNYIQVSKQVGNSIQIIENFKRYNYLENFKLLSDSSLLLIIRDTVSYLGNKPDTVIIKLN